METVPSVDEFGPVSLLKAGGDGVATSPSSPPEKEFSLYANNDKVVGGGSKDGIKTLKTIAESEERSEDDEHHDVERNVEGGGSRNLQMTWVEEQSSGNNLVEEGQQTSKQKDGSPVQGPTVQTQTNSCCDKEGHICFDCFPIPNKLLDQLRRQTGMSNLQCHQTVQTVVNFYKQDLVSSKYFAREATDDDFSEYSQTEEDADDSALLFRATPTPLRRQRLRQERQEREVPLQREPEVPKAKPFMLDNDQVLPSDSELEWNFPTKPPLKLCGADKFRHLVRRLKLDSGSVNWSDARNVSFVFTFFRKLNKVVATMDKYLLKKLALEDDFEFLWTLAKLLRKENRWSIQWEILSILGTVTARDSRSRKYLLESEFPIYLSRVMVDPETPPTKVDAFAELLTVLFIGGKPLPIYLMEHFGVNFVESILKIIENDKSRPGWALQDVFVKLLLVYNLQFNQSDVYNNITILAISRTGPCKMLTTRLIDWMDQKDAPLTASWEVSVSIHQCASKMITDIFRCRTTSHVFSVAQSVMLMTCLTKRLSNFTAGDKRRTSYLKLIQTILRHCKYDYIRNTPCLDNLEEILCERTELSYQDQELIRNIFKEFPQVHQGNYKR